MPSYLIPIFRDHFNKFYRYGYTYVPISQLLKFNGAITKDVKIELTRLFNSLPPFEYDDDYLVLIAEVADYESSNQLYIEISNIVAVYPLSIQAKASFESKLDDRIKLERPEFEEVLKDIEDNIQKKEISRAIDALWLICGLDGSPTTYVEKIGLDSIFQGLEYRRLGTKSMNIEAGNYWSILLAYDRFDYFPNSTIGYFYDSGQVFAYSKSLPTFEGSNLHRFLQQLSVNSPDIKFKDIIASIETDENVTNYITQTTANDILQYFVTPIYLMLKDEIRSADDISRTSLLKYLNHYIDFGENFKYAIVLLASFFGYKKFYDLYYDKLELKFHKTKIKQAHGGKKVKVERPTIEYIEPKKDVTVPESPITLVESKTETHEPVDNNYDIIIQILSGKDKMRISEIVKEFNKRTRKKFNTTNITTVICEMSDQVELIYKGSKIDEVRLKGSNKINDLTLFDT